MSSSSNLFSPAWLAWVDAFNTVSEPLPGVPSSSIEAMLDDHNGSYGLRSLQEEARIAPVRSTLAVAFSAAFRDLTDRFHTARQARRALTNPVPSSLSVVKTDDLEVMLAQQREDDERRRLVNTVVDALRLGMLTTVADEVMREPLDACPIVERVPVHELLRHLWCAVAHAGPEDRPIMDLSERLTWALEAPVAQKIWQTSWPKSLSSDNDRPSSVGVDTIFSIGRMVLEILPSPSLYPLAATFAQRIVPNTAAANAKSLNVGRNLMVGRNLVSTFARTNLFKGNAHPLVFDVWPAETWLVMRQKLSFHHPMGRWILERALERAIKDPQGELAHNVVAQTWLSLDRAEIRRVTHALPDVVQPHLYNLMALNSNIKLIRAPQQLADSLLHPRGQWASPLFQAMGAPACLNDNPTVLAQWLSENDGARIVQGLTTLMSERERVSLRRTSVEQGPLLDPVPSVRRSRL